MPTVKLLRVTENPMELLKVSASQCYQKQATDKVIDHIIEAGHLSVLEHCSATFEITCSLATLLQLTRHRHLSFTVQSSRGSELTSIHKCGNKTIDRTVHSALSYYHHLLNDNHVRYDEAQYILPKAVEYKMVVTGNFRAWFEYLPKRMCKRASLEHQELAHLIINKLILVCPEVFTKCKTPCSNCREKGCSY